MVDLDDLLVGILLAHPGTSEPEVCFRHFGLVAGQVLDERYPRLTADSLNRCLDGLESEEMPPCASEVTMVLNHAASKVTNAKDGQVHLPFLWYGLLDAQSTPLVSRLMSTFETHRTDLFEVQKATEEWLDSGGSQPYESWLKERFPNPQAPTSVVNFKADTTTGSSIASGDLLQIGREVDAFAYLLASKSTRPPLAIGLFGAWGSGKTFFMESVRRRIASLLQEEAVRNQPQGRTPFWKRVISIEFNAWHYVEGDLLASLIDHVFSELRRETYGKAEDPAQAEKEGWLQQLDETGQALEEKHNQLAEAEDQLSSLEAEVRKLESEREEAVRTLDDEVATSSLKESWEAVTKALEDATGRMQLDSGLTVADARRQLDEARREGLRVLGLLRWLGGSPCRLGLALLAVVCLPFVAGAIEYVTKSTALAMFSGGATMAFEALVMCTAFVRQHMDRIDEARDELEAEVQTIRREYQKEIDAKADALKTQRDDVSSKQTQINELEKERDRLRAKIDTPAGVRIRRFLDERIGSGEYRSRLGVPAIIRRDLRRLTSYILDQNRGLKESEENKPLPEYQVNRIVLYIDDLDRCPGDKVIQVLQAVHLLLAFELFVVVVAVDSRWLSQALMDQYPALALDVNPADNADRARPRDYLEKIFQVPFFVRPLGNAGRTSIVRGLLGDHLRHEGEDGGGGGGTPVKHRRIEEQEARVLDTQISVRQPPAALATEAFSVTQAELEFVESLAPLLGDTPRAVKRFVNLFQLLRVLLIDDQAIDQVRDSELAAFLLAIGNTDFEFASRLMNTPPETLQSLISDPPPVEIAPVPAPVADWLKQPTAAHWLPVARDRIERLGDIVQRFSFG